MKTNRPLDRRSFLKSAGGTLAATSLGAAGPGLAPAAEAADPRHVLFPKTDSLYHGDGWESLNPGYWQIQDGALRRRFHHYGERALKRWTTLLAPASCLAPASAARKVVQAFRPFRQHAARAIRLRPSAAQATADPDSKRAEARDYFARARFAPGIPVRRQESSPGLQAVPPARKPSSRRSSTGDRLGSGLLLVPHHATIRS